MSKEKIRETVAASFRAEPPRELRKTAKLLQKAGARRASDLLIARRDDRVEPWQSDAYARISFLLAGKEQYLDDELWSELVVEYPLVSVPESWSDAYVSFVEKCAAALGLSFYVEGAEGSVEGLRATLRSAAQELRTKHFEPGSEELRWLVESQYG